MKISCTNLRLSSPSEAAVTVVMSFLITSSAWLGPDKTTISSNLSESISSLIIVEIRLCDFCSRPLDAWMNNLFDFIDPLTNSEELKDLFTLVDGSASMYQMLENRQAGIEVLFGVDMSPDWVTNLSLVTGKFKRQKQEFTLGLIGPTTMPYHRIIGLMEKMITELTNY